MILGPAIDIMRSYGEGRGKAQDDGSWRNCRLEILKKGVRYTWEVGLSCVPWVLGISGRWREVKK